MAVKTNILRYNLCDFMNQQHLKHNNTVDPELQLYFYKDNRKIEKPNLNIYLDNMQHIISIIMNTNNTEEVEFKSYIKYCINTLNKKNYEEYAEKILLLDFSTKDNFSTEDKVNFLANNLIICAMRCPIGVKGLNKNDTVNVKPICEICANLILFFSEKINNTVSFKEKFLRLCRMYFTDFMSLLKSMDENNEDTADNYKGFMTLMGLMYRKGIISSKIIFECIDSIKRTIFNSKINYKTEQITTTITRHHEKMFGYLKKFDDDLYNSIVYFDSNINQDNYICYRNQMECTNFYKGYENLMNNVIYNMDDTNIANYVTVHQEFMTLNKKYKIKNRNNVLVPPLKLHLVIIHNDIGEKINKELTNHPTIQQRYNIVNISK